VYSPPPRERVGESYVTPFHTDSGILLLITPAPELPLQVLYSSFIGTFCGSFQGFEYRGVKLREVRQVVVPSLLAGGGAGGGEGFDRVFMREVVMSLHL
jgi:hypothetical protein